MQAIALTRSDEHYVEHTVAGRYSGSEIEIGPHEFHIHGFEEHVASAVVLSVEAELEGLGCTFRQALPEHTQRITHLRVGVCKLRERSTAVRDRDRAREETDAHRFDEVA